MKILKDVTYELMVEEIKDLRLKLTDKLDYSKLSYHKLNAMRNEYKFRIVRINEAMRNISMLFKGRNNG